VLKHAVERLLARLFAHLGVRADAAANDVLEPADNPLRNRRRGDDNAADEAFVADISEALNREGGGNGDVCIDAPVMTKRV
jgi:hypothetical protein